MKSIPKHQTHSSDQTHIFLCLHAKVYKHTTAHTNSVIITHKDLLNHHQAQLGYTHQNRY